MLADMNAINENTVIVTTVHDDQVIINFFYLIFLIIKNAERNSIIIKLNSLR